MNVNPDVQEIIEYLESNDLEIVKHFQNIVQEKLYASRDHSLLGTLTDKYIQTKSDRLLELLVAINDSHAMHLFERMNDHLKHGALTEVCTLLFSIVQKQPSWLHKIVGTQLFTTFLKFLKNDHNIVFIMNGLIILCMLMPCVPAIIGPHHGDILEVFVRTSGLLLNKSGQIPEVWILHLHISVYILFHRLYSMYPNNFLTYMRSCYGGQRKKDPVFQLIIKPMFEFVKLHPDVITETPKSETALEKWKVFQPHDVLADCQKISLDPIDCMKEASYAIFPAQVTEESSLRQYKDSSFFLGLNSVFSHPDSTYFTPLKDANNSDKCTERKSIFNDITALCNPSDICGMTTPPSSRPVSPSSSAYDVSSLLGGPRRSTCDELRDSTQTLNDLPYERKSSGETISINSNTSPSTRRNPVKKTKSFGSSDNVNHKSLIKNWLPGSASHSTPFEKELTHSRQSAPVSPRKPSGSKSQPKRPKSTEIFKHKIVKQLSLVSSDQFSVHSAPTSPMVHNMGPSHFSFNMTPDQENDLKNDEMYDSKDLYKTAQKKMRCHALHIDVGQKHNLNNTTINSTGTPSKIDSTISVQFLNSVRQMFSELCAKPIKEVNETQEGTDVQTCTAQHKVKSPLNLLDDFIQYGTDIHSFQLSRIPLTSQLETDWTYFGGAAPVDEVKIFQTQVHLLHIQLLYERHKCELHCLRNRRLFGSVQKSQALQHELLALKDQIILADRKLDEMRYTITRKSDENRLIRQQAATKEQDLISKIQKLEIRNKELEYKLKNTKLKKKELKLGKEKIQKELNKAKHHLFETTQEILNTQPKLDEIEKLRTTIENFEKELVVQSEKQERVKAHVHDFQLKNHRDQELLMKLDSHRHELKMLQEEKECMQASMESYKLKLNELESSSAKKEKLIREHKGDVQALRARHKNEVQALEDRLHSSQKTCHSLQSYITSLYSKLDESRSNHSSGNMNIQNQQSSQPSLWDPHYCEDKCRKSSSYAGLESIHSTTFRDHSHRHTMQSSYTTYSDDNPFRSRSHASSVTSVYDSLRKQSYKDSVKQDSGIERSSDVILQKTN